MIIVILCIKVNELFFFAPKSRICCFHDKRRHNLARIHICLSEWGSRVDSVEGNAIQRVTK